METKVLKIYVEQKATQDGRKFNVYKTYSKHDRKLDVKFRKDCNDVPTSTCYITVDVNEMNITKGEYPTVWIKSIVSVQSLQEKGEESNSARVNEFFD